MRAGLLPVAALVLLILQAQETESPRDGAAPTADAPPAADPPDLGALYPWRTMMLSFPPLFDLQVHLRREGPAEVATAYPAAWILSAFLEQHVTVHLGLSVAALVLDLDAMKAGYKRSDDPTGTIQELPWSAEEVAAVARLCHDFLVARRTFAARGAELGDRSLPEAWEFLTSEPSRFVDPAMVCEAWERFADGLYARAEELDALATTAPELRETLLSLRSAYGERAEELRDARRDALLSERALELVAYVTGTLDDRDWALLTGMGGMGEVVPAMADMGLLELESVLVRSQREYPALWGTVLEQAGVEAMDLR